MDPVLSTLKAKGYRQTRILKTLLELFDRVLEPLSAPDISALFMERGETVNKTTIYRELYSLTNSQILREVDFGDGTKRYELATAEHHHHIICSKCKKVHDTDLNTELDKEESRIAQETGFKVLHHRLEFFGICRNCQNS